jgi:group I intron endonuclease
LRHLRSLRAGTHHNIFFQRVFDKYGEASFDFHLIKTTTVEEARTLEQYLLDKHLSKTKCMNIGASSSGGDNLTKNPRRHLIIAKMTKSLQARMESLSATERQFMFGSPGTQNGMYGKTHTAKARLSISNANRGKHFNLGVPKSDEHRRRISEFAKTRTGEKNSFHGKEHSVKTKRHLSKIASARAESGILPSNTLRIKVGRKVYRSAAQAAKALGCVTATVLNRVRNENYPDYKFADQMPNDYRKAA